jgi:hypothetical protein
MLVISITLRSDFSVLPPPISSPSPFDKSLYLYSFQGTVIIDLLDNFLKLLKAFSGCGEQFLKTTRRNNVRGLGEKDEWQTG